MLIFFSYLFLAVQPDLGLAIPELVGICGWIIILLAVCQIHTDETEITLSPAFIVFLAAVFRSMFLWRIPELSDDIYRYLFDGLMMVTGSNPYLDSPSNIGAATPQMAELIPLINHANMTTIYPPAAQVVFAVGILFSRILDLGSLVGMKLFLVILDLVSCTIIIKILMIFKLSKNRAVLYAWHPLPVIEIGASGHIDAAAVFFLIIAVGLLILIYPENRQGRARCDFNKYLSLVLAGIFMAFAILTKWFPLVFMPGLWLTVKPGLRRYLVFGCFTAAGVLIWPFLPEFVNGLKTLNTYLQNWEFSGFAFRQLRQWIGNGEVVRLILGSGLFFLIAGLTVWQRLQKTNFLQMFKVFYIISFAYLVITPTMHPWYALYMVFFLPFVADSAALTLGGLLVSWSILLAYRVLISYRLQGVWIEDDLTAFMVVVAPVGFFSVFIFLNFFQRHLRMHEDN